MHPTPHIMEPSALLDEEEDSLPIRVGEMSDEAVLSRLQRVDDRLREWRGETVRRRAVSDHHADMALAKRRAQVALGVFAAGVICGISAMLVWNPAEPVPAVVVVDAPTGADLQPQDVLQPQDALQPQDVLQPQDAKLAALQPQDVRIAVEPPSPPVAAADAPFALVGSGVETWTEGGMLRWRFDYQASAPMELRWLDGAGEPTLSPMQCNGHKGNGVLHCYKARSTQRMVWEQSARGAAPGTWTLQGCVAGDCGVLTTFEVPAAG